MDSEAREVLGRIGLFSGVLSARQLDELASKCRLVDAAAGQTIMAEGDFGASMFAVIEGELGVSLHGSRNPVRGIAKLGPGDIFGEMSLMTGARRTATVTATTASRLIEITKVALEGLFQRSPDLLDRFGAFLAKRQAELERIHADEHARRIFGIKTEDIAGAMRRFFGGWPPENVG